MIWFLLIGCGQESSATWLQGASYHWVGFNHRVNHIEYRLGDDVGVSIVGGTSTSGVFNRVHEGCDSATCAEFPVRDQAEVEVEWAKITTTKAVFASGTAQIVADADGETTSLSVALPNKGKGSAVAMLQGFRLSTNQPLEGGSECYRPENGWLPKRLLIELGDATLSADGTSVDLDVTAAFEAGPTYEDARQCLDAVIARARVAYEVDVTVVVTNQAIDTATVSYDQAYTFSGNSSAPGEQPSPDLSGRTLSLGKGGEMVGWSKFAFDFHEIGESRGAYLRTFDLTLDTAGGVVSGHADNYSPPTQLSAFDYVFTGEVVSADVGGEITQGTVEKTVDVELLDDGSPEVWHFDY